MHRIFTRIPSYRSIKYCTCLVRIVGLEFSHKFLSLGGYSDGSYLDIAAKMEEISFDRAIWTNVGTLLTKREWNRSIVVDNTIIHVGGHPGNQ